MVCKDARELLSGYIDGELDPSGNVEVLRHLQACDACSEVYNRERSLHSLMQDPALKFNAPHGLRRRIESAVRNAEHAESARPAIALHAPWQWLSAAALLASLAAVIWVAAVRQGSSHGDLIAQEVVSSHVRSLMAGHLTDVSNSDRHTVKPWFNGRLDFSPPVKDLSPQGFVLVGGRLDYLGESPAAALVYRRRQHVINLFVWPVRPDHDGKQEVENRRGYNLIHWTESGMAYWAVSDLNIGELRQFVQLISE